jgi:HAD superfamily hydrolase (TIGR01484 family)
MKTIVLDLGGTLTVSKDPLDDEMVTLISKILPSYNVAIISGAPWKQVCKQINGLLSLDQGLLNNLYLLPASGGSLYQSWPRYGWVAAYQHKLATRDIDRINNAFEEAIAESSFETPQKLWGKQFENCDSKITFAALGQKVPFEVKEKWDVDGNKRRVLVESLRKKLQSYDVRIAGMNSIDVSMKGINKKYGIDELMKRLHVSKDDVVYVGDSIFKGGSDYAAVEMGLNNVPVRDPGDTKAWIRDVLDGKAQILQAKISI